MNSQEGLNRFLPVLAKVRVADPTESEQTGVETGGRKWGNLLYTNQHHRFKDFVASGGPLPYTTVASWLTLEAQNSFVARRPAAIVSLGSLLEMQSLRPHLRPPES